MSIKRIGDAPSYTRVGCFDPEHNPPTHWCPPPGVYEHVCPSCGKRMILTIPGYTLQRNYNERDAMWRTEARALGNV